MNNPILITGCQRSGTTLLHLILDSHPDITGVDEIGFRKVPLSDYLNRPEFHPYVSFKLPVVSFQAEVIRTIPGIKVLWCIRDPRDVVLSMMNLQLRISAGVLLPWVVHPAGAGREIENSAGTLKKMMSAELASCYATFRNIAAKSPESWQTGDKVYVGALCWRMKQELLDVYRQLGIPYHILHYEKLIRNPEHTIRDILDFVGLPWHENVLKHHQLHSGTSVGGTVNDRPIDETNTGKWAASFDAHALSVISGLCSDTAALYGYQLSD